VIALNGAAGIDKGDLSDVEVAALFGQTTGFKAGEPNITPTEQPEEDDF
jgi:hypothetical protein